MTSINQTGRIPYPAALLALGIAAFRFAQEPALHDLWRKAADDCSGVVGAVSTAIETVTEARGSIVEAGKQTAASWRRHVGRDPQPFPHH